MSQALALVLIGLVGIMASGFVGVLFYESGFERTGTVAVIAVLAVTTALMFLVVRPRVRPTP